MSRSERRREMVFIVLAAILCVAVLIGAEIVILDAIGHMHTTR